MMGSIRRLPHTMPNSWAWFFHHWIARFGRLGCHQRSSFFAWLALQDRIWTSDRLAKRGWVNRGLCPLCKREQETGAHLFFRCRYTIRLWKLIIDKLGLVPLDPYTWHLEESVIAWWDRRTDASNPDKKAFASLTMLVSWTVWNGRNSRVFRYRSAPRPILLHVILEEAKLQVTQGAKNQGNIFLRE